MDTEIAVNLLFSTAQENWIWLTAAFGAGLIVGWVSYSSRRRSALGR